MLKINEQVRDALVAYLETKPFKEVAGGIQALLNLEKIQEPQKAQDAGDKVIGG